jgi:Protein of unknown function (DUF4238)
MAKISAKHHTVPQGILKNFCHSNDKFYYYSKSRPSEGVCSRDVEKKFFRRHYYSIKTSAGVRSDEFEREFLQKLDSQFAAFIRELIQILDSGAAPQWNNETGDFARQFIYYYQKRSPDFYETLNPEATVSQVVSEASVDPALAEIPGRDAFFERFKTDTQYRTDLAEFARVKAQARESPVVMARLCNMSLAIAKAAPRSQFIVGSHPVVRLGAGSDRELGDGVVELWTPISPRYCIGVFGASRDDEHLVIELEQRKVKRLNNAIYRQSRQVGSASERLLKSIVFTKLQDLN